MLVTYGDMLLLLKLGEQAAKINNKGNRIIDIDTQEMYQEIQDEVNILVDKFNDLAKERRVHIYEVINEIIDRLSKKFTEYKFKVEE